MRPTQSMDGSSPRLLFMPSVWLLQLSYVRGTQWTSLDSPVEFYFLESLQGSLLLFVEDACGPLHLSHLKSRLNKCSKFTLDCFANLKLRPFLQAAASYLNDKEEVLPVKIFACRALANYCPQMKNPAEVSAYLSGE